MTMGNPAIYATRDVHHRLSLVQEHTLMAVRILHSERLCPTSSRLTRPEKVWDPSHLQRTARLPGIARHRLRMAGTEVRSC